MARRNNGGQGMIQLEVQLQKVVSRAKDQPTRTSSHYKGHSSTHQILISQQY